MHWYYHLTSDGLRSLNEFWKQQPESNLIQDFYWKKSQSLLSRACLRIDWPFIRFALKLMFLPCFPKVSCFHVDWYYMIESRKCKAVEEFLNIWKQRDLSFHSENGRQRSIFKTNRLKELILISLVETLRRICFILHLSKEDIQDRTNIERLGKLQNICLFQFQLMLTIYFIFFFFNKTHCN